MSKRREGMYWEVSGKISKLKNNFLQVAISTAHHEINYLLQPENVYTAYCVLIVYSATIDCRQSHLFV